MSISCHVTEQRLGVEGLESVVLLFLLLSAATITVSDDHKVQSLTCFCFRIKTSKYPTTQWRLTYCKVRTQ